MVSEMHSITAYMGYQSTVIGAYMFWYGSMLKLEVDSMCHYGDWQESRRISQAPGHLTNGDVKVKSEH